MTNIDFKEKLVGAHMEDSVTKIIVTHVTIRQSIFFLHLRLVTLEIFAAFGLVAFLILIFSNDVTKLLGDKVIVFNIPIYLILVLIKIGFMIFIIVAWLNEYYEITPKEVIYKKGLIFKKEEKHRLSHIGLIQLEQGIFGRIFNFGTLKLYNWTTEKDVLLYLIHNPMKYQEILEKLLPEADKGKKVFREHVLELEE